MWQSAYLIKKPLYVLRGCVVKSMLMSHAKIAQPRASPAKCSGVFLLGQQMHGLSGPHDSPCIDRPRMSPKAKGGSAKVAPGQASAPACKAAKVGQGALFNPGYRRREGMLLRVELETVDNRVGEALPVFSGLKGMLKTILM
jgi:hypothetical protein